MYLQHRNEAERKKQEEYDNYVKEQREKEAMKQLSEEKRQAILKVDFCKSVDLWRE